MAKSLSIDLRQRVIAAIDGGLSCRQAAERFGVSAASAIRWRERQRKAGDFSPQQQGGDRRSKRVEAQAQLILNMVRATPDITLAELRESLGGMAYPLGSPRSGAFSSVGKSRSKKDSARRRAATSRCKRGARGVVRGTNRSRPGSPCLHRRDRSQHEDGSPLRALRARRAVPRRRPARALEDDDIHRWLALGWDYRAAGPGWSDRWKRFPRMGRAIARAVAASGRHRHHGQPARPQGSGRARSDRGRRREPALSSAL